MKISLMIEGQQGLNWPRWQALAEVAETCGYAGLYRSDHYTDPHPPDRDSLELWISLAWLASHTRRIHFGPMVSPVSFREPTMTARMAAAVSDLSGGRLVLGLGAGWQAREHENYGFELLNIEDRFARFHEGLDVITGLLRNDLPFSYQGRFYRLKDAILLPRPAHPIPILIGGNGLRRTLPTVEKYADEWNGVHLTAEAWAERSRQIRAGIRRSLMAGIVCASDESELARRLAGYDEGAIRAKGYLIGTPAQLAEQVAAFREVGVQEIMLQWQEQEDLETLRHLARTLIG